MDKWLFFIDGNNINSGVDSGGNNINLNSLDSVNLDPYTNRNGNETLINFVGFIITKEINIVCFPKNYISLKNMNKISKSDIKLLSRFLLSIKNRSGISSLSLSNDDVNAFPIKAYVGIVSYYIKHGLYVSNYVETTKHESGRNNWRKTLRKSKNFFDKEGNLIFIPILKNRKMIRLNFISECMESALYNGYNDFGKIFSIGIPYRKKINSISVSKALYNLNLFKRYVKKDIDKKLINDLIIFYKWENVNNKKVVFGTNDFAPIWEISTRFLLNNYFENVVNIINDNSNEQIEIDDYLKGNSFKKVTQHLDRYGKNNQNIQYDDLLIGKNYIYIFDAKYYGNLDKVDHKQIVYHFFISAATRDNIKGISIDNYDVKNKQKIDALILPTHNVKGYYKIMIDMTYAAQPDIDIPIFKDLKIYKLFYPVKELMRLVVD